MILHQGLFCANQHVVYICKKQST